MNNNDNQFDMESYVLGIQRIKNLAKEAGISFRDACMVTVLGCLITICSNTKEIADNINKNKGKNK